jgi:dTDP-4-dehydrorhamnose 3,5-epimerase
MRFLPTELPGVVVVEPVVHRDPRGFFLESYHHGKFAAGGIDVVFVQDNHSKSAGGILRGLHAQVAKPQGKLMRVIEGAIWDVAVDIRPWSATYRRWVGVELSAESFRQLYIPPGYAHGFCVLGEGAQVVYKCTELYDPADEIAIAWNDPDVGIAWPLEQPVLSARDAAAPRLRELEPRLLSQPRP